MGALLRGVKREQLKRGQVICAPGSLKSVSKFQAQIYVLTKDEGKNLFATRTQNKPRLKQRYARRAIHAIHE